MPKKITWILIGCVALILALGMAVGAAFFLRPALAQSGIAPWPMMGGGMMLRGGINNQATPAPGYGVGPCTGQGYGGMMGGAWGSGMMGNWNNQTAPAGARISMDQAIKLAEQSAARYGSDLKVSEVMEFSNNFYAVVKEASTGRGAFELLIDPVTGSVYPEHGPNMMWNSKYNPMGGMMGAMMGWVAGGDNTLTLEQAAEAGQKYLDTALPGAQLETDGTAFYGHYTFDYKVGDKIAGMLSVNGTSGAVWMHTWHGEFIAEQEVGE